MKNPLPFIILLLHNHFTQQTHSSQNNTRLFSTHTRAQTDILLSSARGTDWQQLRFVKHESSSRRRRRQAFPRDCTVLQGLARTQDQKHITLLIQPPAFIHLSTNTKHHIHRAILQILFQTLRSLVDFFSSIAQKQFVLLKGRTVIESNF